MSADGTAGLPNSIITRPRVRRQSTAYRGTAAAASRCALDRAGGTLATSGAAWRERCQPTGLPSRRRCQPAGASLVPQQLIADERSASPIGSGCVTLSAPAPGGGSGFALVAGRLQAKVLTEDEA